MSQLDGFSAKPNLNIFDRLAIDSFYIYFSKWLGQTRDISDIIVCCQHYWTLDSQTQIQNHPWVGIHFQILDKYRKSSQGREIQFLFSASQLGGEICHPWFFIPAILTINLTIFIPIIITITLNITIAICIIIFITIMMTLVYGWVILSSGRGCQLHCQPSLFISSLIIVIIISCLLSLY